MLQPYSYGLSLLKKIGVGFYRTKGGSGARRSKVPTKGPPLPSDRDWELESSLPEFQTCSFLTLAEKVLGCRFTSQRAEKGFIITSFLKQVLIEFSGTYMPITKVWLEQTVNSLGSIEFLQVENLSGVNFILGTWS